MNKSTSQILQEARALIERGWIKRSYHDGGDRYCIDGALAAAAEWGCHEIHNHPARKVISNLLGPRTSPAIWQDHPHRSKQQVLELFDRALTEVTK